MRYIDVREYPEYAAAHIAGSELVPLGTLDAASHSWDRAAPLTLVCRTGRRAEQAKRLLDAKGFHAATVLHGGILAWQHADGQVAVAAYQPWSLERQVRIAAGSLVLAFAALGLLASPKFYLGTTLVGAGLVFAGVSDLCMMASVLGRMPWNRRRQVQL